MLKHLCLLFELKQVSLHTHPCCILRCSVDVEHPEGRRVFSECGGGGRDVCHPHRACAVVKIVYHLPLVKVLVTREHASHDVCVSEIIL